MLDWSAFFARIIEIGPTLRPRHAPSPNPNSNSPLIAAYCRLRSGSTRRIDPRPEGHESGSSSPVDAVGSKNLLPPGDSTPSQWREPMKASGEEEP